MIEHKHPDRAAHAHLGNPSDPHTPRDTFTPGPWHMAYGAVYKAGLVDGKESEDAICIGHADRNEPTTRPTERDANVRLMAAAPELYEALAHLLDRIRIEAKEPTTFYAKIGPVMDQGVRALAKAVRP